MSIITHIFKKTGKISRRFLVLGIIIILVFGFYLNSRNKNSNPLQFAEVKKQDLKQEISASGALTGKNSSNLHFKSSGKLKLINVEVGDRVIKGEVIAELDTKDLSIALQQAQNTYRDKQASAEKALDDVKNHDKDETLTQRKDRTTAEVARDNAYESVKAAQRAFQDAEIISPIDGIVTQAIQLAGQTVTSTDLIAQVVNTSDIYFDTDVDEADFGKLSLGLPSEVTLDAYSDSIFKGKVDQILPQTKTTSSGATVVTVRIKLDDPNDKTFNHLFINGLTGQASIITDEAKNVLTIPQEALREDSTVVVPNGKDLISKKVAIGIRSDTDVEIKQGLEENEEVLFNPPPAPETKLNQNRLPFGGILRFFGGGRAR